MSYLLHVREKLFLFKEVPVYKQMFGAWWYTFTLFSSFASLRNFSVNGKIHMCEQWVSAVHACKEVDEGKCIFFVFELHDEYNDKKRNFFLFESKALISHFHVRVGRCAAICSTALYCFTQFYRFKWRTFDGLMKFFSWYVSLRWEGMIYKQWLLIFCLDLFVWLFSTHLCSDICYIDKIHAKHTTWKVFNNQRVKKLSNTHISSHIERTNVKTNKRRRKKQTYGRQNCWALIKPLNVTGADAVCVCVHALLIYIGKICQMNHSLITEINMNNTNLIRLN